MQVRRTTKLKAGGKHIDNSFFDESFFFPTAKGQAHPENAGKRNTKDKRTVSCWVAHLTKLKQTAAQPPALNSSSKEHFYKNAMSCI